MKTIAERAERFLSEETLNEMAVKVVYDTSTRHNIEDVLIGTSMQNIIEDFYEKVGTDDPKKVTFTDIKYLEAQMAGFDKGTKA